jgi:hypothetical protein
MPYWDHFTVVIGTCAVIVLSLKAYFRFNRYCEDMAKFEGRLAKFQELRSDEGGLNSYERQQYKMLMNRDFSHVTDEALLFRSLSLAKDLERLRIISILFILLISATYMPW